MHWRLETNGPKTSKELRTALNDARVALPDNSSEDNKQMMQAIEAACSIAEGLSPTSKVQVSISGHGSGHVPGVGARFSVAVDEVVAPPTVAPASKFEAVQAAKGLSVRPPK